MPKAVRVAVPPSESPPSLFASANLSGAYFPGWGLLYSFLIHAMAFAAVLLFPVVYGPKRPFLPPPREAKDNPWATKSKRSQVRTVFYLPTIGGGGQGDPGEEEPAPSRPSAAEASSPPGLVHPGPQQIRSDPPSPTNRTQTLLRPGREDLPILKSPANLPNLISVRDAGTSLQPSLPDPDFVLPNMAKPAKQQPANFPKPFSLTDVGAVLQPRLPDAALGLPDMPKPKEQPPAKPSDGTSTQPLPSALEKLPTPRPLPDLPMPTSLTDAFAALHPSLPNQSAKLPEAVQPHPSDSGVEPSHPADDSLPPAEAPEPELPAALPLNRTDLGNLLALSPAPILPNRPVEIPNAEARGLFAISPQPNPAAPETAAGSPQAGNPPSMVTVTFGSSAAAAAGASAGGGGEESGSRPGSASGPGIGPGSGAGAGPGTGPFPGITVVGGIAGSETEGSGAGAGPDAEPFAGIAVVGGIPGAEASGSGAGTGPVAGITVIGGVGGSEPSANSLPENRISPPVPAKYDIWVLSTEDSGGGLPYFGVFSNEQIHTVYFDMRQAETEAAPVWTFEFAEPRRTDDQADPSRQLEASRQGFVKPAPVVKEMPRLPAELLQKCKGKMVIVFGVINAEGKMEQMSVKQSPDPLLNPPLLEALSKWEFQPGRLDGNPVAVKTLLGIPLWSPAPHG